MGLLASVTKRVNRLRTYFLLTGQGVKMDWPSLRITGVPYVRNRGILEIGKNVVINSRYEANPMGSQTFTSLVVEKKGHLLISEGAGISNSSFYCAERITVGKHVFIGGDCKIYDTDFHSLSFAQRLSGHDEDIKTAPVFIDDGAFIGTCTIVLKGVHIGRESVIGAGSVVAKSVPFGEIWAGNPARFIKKVPGAGL